MSLWAAIKTAAFCFKKCEDVNILFQLVFKVVLKYETHFGFISFIGTFTSCAK